MLLANFQSERISRYRGILNKLRAESGGLSSGGARVFAARANVCVAAPPAHQISSAIRVLFTMLDMGV